MHCASCEVLIKDSLEEKQGIDHADVSHTQGSAVVDFDEKRVTEKDIIKIIEIDGYEISNKKV